MDIIASNAKNAPTVSQYIAPRNIANQCYYFVWFWGSDLTIKTKYISGVTSTGVCPESGKIDQWSFSNAINEAMCPLRSVLYHISLNAVLAMLQ